jgi:hypothetical protein
MDNKERNKLLHLIGSQLAKHLKGFYGKITFNLQDGRYVNSNIEESIKPPKKNN